MAAALLGAILVSGCDPVPVDQGNKLPVIASSAVLSSQTETLTEDQIHQVMDTSPGAAYKLGPDDVIAVNVYLHPELSVPLLGSASGTGGALITSDGSVELPLIGNIHLGGMTLPQAQAAITAAYNQYINAPEVAVQLAHAQSLSYYLLGAFTDPGIKYPVHQLNLLEALALGGSVDMPNADLYEAYVAQGSVKLPVDLYALLVNGDLSQNVTLAAGDAIVVPSSINENAYVFGAVGKPGAVPFASGSLSLLQSLSVAGLDLSNFSQARLSRIHIIRARGRDASFYIVDANMILHGQAASFALEPGDIVFVPPTAVASWNQVLDQLLPSLQTVAATLEPFVQINYLKHQ